MKKRTKDGLLLGFLLYGGLFVVSCLAFLYMKFINHLGFYGNAAALIGILGFVILALFLGFGKKEPDEQL